MSGEEVEAPMTNEQAFEVVAQACASVQGNLQTHQAVQNALMVLARALQAPPPNREARRAATKKPPKNLAAVK